MGVLGAWSFASAAMLWWGMAAAVPLLIHLWSRWRYDEVQWGAMQFLAAALREHQRRVQLEQVVLLALRILMLVLLALALAEPVVTGLALGRNRGAQASRLVTILVVDGSYSMRHREGDASRFEQARAAALHKVRAAETGAKFALVLMANPPHMIIAEPSADHAAVARVIEQLEPTEGGAELRTTLLILDQLVHSLEAQGADEISVAIQWFTDLGRTTWEAASTNECRVLLHRLDERCHLALTTFGEQQAANSAITEIRTPDRLPVAGDEVEWEVEVANYGFREETRKRIELRVGDQPALEKFVDVPAGGRAIARFPQRLDTPGESWLQASIADDGLALDNTRWIAAPVRDAIRVLCIQGSAHAADYVAMALAPEPQTNSTIRPEVASEQRLLDIDTTEYDAVFLCNVARVTDDEAAALQRHVARGGGLILILGDLVQVDNYNEQLGATSGSRLLPAKIGDVQRGAVRRFDPLDYRHPLTAAFRGHQRAGLLTAPTWVYRRLDSISDQAQVALAFDNGDPALISESIGQGRVLLWATAAALDVVDRQGETITPWTILPSWPSFPPLIHEMLYFACGGQPARRNVLVGQRTGSRIPSVTLSDANRLQSPSGKEQRLTTETPTHEWRSEPLLTSGVYRASYGQPEQLHELFAVNVDAAEGDLAALDQKSLVEYFGQQPLPQHSSQARDALHFFRWLLASVLLLMAAETFLAWSFGRGAR